MIKIQCLAARTVGKVLTGASLTAVLQGLWNKHTTLSDQQRGAIQDISYGVLRFYGQLDALLRRLINKPLKDQDLYCLLLVGLYQLQYSRSSAYAIVDHAVTASLRLNCSRGAQGLINAVLRGFVRQRKTLLKSISENEVGQYSHPQWWIDKLRVEYPQNYKKILETNNQHPIMSLRVNQQKISVLKYQDQLNKCGISSQIIWNKALKLKQPVTVKKLPGFSQGLVSVQDAGAQLAAIFLDINDGMHILDACAAPGGKSGHLLELADIELTALDNDPKRLVLVTQNLERLTFDKYHAICGNAANPSEWWDGKLFDRILIDAPCSASGVVRRHPDIKWLRRESDLARFVKIQQKILNALWQTLSRDGKLLYVTCSIFIEENKQQVKDFLCHHSDARNLPLPKRKLLDDGQLLPDSQHDGFFYTLLQKV